MTDDRQSANRVLAVGAAGPFAGLVVPELAKRGAHIRGFVQHPEQENDVRKAGAEEVVVGDITMRSDVEAALRGMDAVFYIAPAFLKNEAEVGQNFVAAAKAAGVRRFVFSSVIHPTLSALDNHRAKAPVEEAVLESNLEYTFLHPGLFFQNFARGWAGVVKDGVYGEPWAIESRFSRVDYRDVAEVAAIALTENRLLNGTFELCAPGELNRNDVVALMSEVIGKRVRAVRVAPPTEDSPMKRMFDFYDQHNLVGNALTLQAILGRVPRTLRAYFEELTGAGVADAATLEKRTAKR